MRRNGRLPVAPEDELTYLLAGTAERRRNALPRVGELVGRVDFESLAARLEGQMLLPLLGTRLERMEADRLPAAFRRRVEEALGKTRVTGLLYEETSRQLLGELERLRIPAVALKGALLGRDVHGDPALRPCADVDLLVDPGDLGRAAAALETRGYAPPEDPPWENGLPLLHHTLAPRQPWLPPVELHWRIHWYETEFSRELLARSPLDSSGRRRPSPQYELAALLAFFARDSFFGLRLPVDIAAWWDAHAARLSPGALDPIVAAHPELRPALTTAAAVVDELVGVPSDLLLSAPSPQGRRARSAARLANWTAQGERRQIIANITLVDWLLSPRGAQARFLRRHIVQPLPYVARTYGIPQDARARQVARAAAYAVGTSARFTLGFGRALWRVRGNRPWAPLPRTP